MAITQKDRKQSISLLFGDFSGGMNSQAAGIAVKRNQFQAGLNVLVDDSGGGFKRAPGLVGLSTAETFAAYIRGLFGYRQYDGTESLIAVSNSKISSVNTSSGALSDLYTIGGSNALEAWAATVYNKLFVANGVDVIKIENATAYKVGIVAPTGVQAAAAAGGSLPDGVYAVYACYARVVSASNVLYSAGQSLGNVTLGSGNNTIAITSFANSADPQVGNKVIFMTDAGGSTIYYYYATGNNTTTSFNITSSATRNASIEYNVVAGPNQRPGALEWIAQCGDRLIGGINNIVYYSLPGTSVYDLERWPTANYREYPHKTLGAFELNGQLYINTTHGIYRQPDANFAAKWQYVEKRLYFKYPRTVQIHNGVAWGLTNDGFRYFDGVSFSIDLSVDIKPEIDKIVSGYHDNFRPCGIIYTRSGVRTEYQLSFRDNSVSTTCNNRTLVLNLDRIKIQDANNFLAPWEVWDTGFQYATVFDSGVLYKAQHIATAGTVIKENLSAPQTNADQYIYNSAGTFITELTPKEATITSRIEMPDIFAICTWEQAYVVAQIAASTKLTLTIDDVFDLSDDESMDVSNSGQFILDQDLLDQNVVSNPSPNVYIVPLRDDVSGRMVSVKISQTADDFDFNLYQIKLRGLLETGAYI